MAQWSHQYRTLHAKIVYYGPALGGKTANLESLRVATDPGGRCKMLSVHTTDDRTLFFDVLQVQIDDLFGYRMVLRLFGVPGQVRYDAARKVVLSGADAIVFVADSRVGREEQNRWSLQNLQMNMRANRLDSARVPVVYQFNKQDLPDAATPEEVAAWLSIPREEAFEAVATEGRGVLPTFAAANRLMLESLLKSGECAALANIDPREIGPQLDGAFAPFIARQEWAARCDRPERECSGHTRERLVFKGEELLQEAIRTGVKLGERLCSASSSISLLEWEAAAYRALCRSQIDAGAGAAGVVADAVESAAVSLIHVGNDGWPVLDRIYGKGEEPLLSSERGRQLARELCAAREPRIIADLHRECPDHDSRRSLLGIRGVAALPVPSHPARLMLVYSQLPDGAFEAAQMRFLSTAAGLVGAGLRQAALGRELRGHGERLSRMREGLRDVEASHHGFLRGISHHSLEILADIRDAAVSLRDRRSQGRKRAEALAAIVDSSETLRDRQEELIGTSARMQEQVETLLRLLETQHEDANEEEVCNAG